MSVKSFVFLCIGTFEDAACHRDDDDDDDRLDRVYYLHLEAIILVNTFKNHA
jgi:hypothetical protein